MPNKGNDKLAFNAGGPVVLSLPGRCYSYEIYSNDDAIYVAEDELATVGSYRIPQNTISERIIPCTWISVRGVSGAGLAEVKWIPMENNAVTDQYVMDTRVPMR